MHGVAERDQGPASHRQVGHGHCLRSFLTFLVIDLLGSGPSRGSAALLVLSIQCEIRFSTLTYLSSFQLSEYSFHPGDIYIDTHM